MKNIVSTIWKDLQAIRKNGPLIQNITNYVVMETTANALLALGASPVMAHAKEEMVDMVSIAQSLVLNLGTLSEEWVKSMKLALKQAKKLSIPVVLDPVGAGATPYRTKTALALIKQGGISVIRGNASELLSLAGEESLTKGVDSSLSTIECVSQVKSLSLKLNATVCMSGVIDLISDGHSTWLIDNGHLMMTKVTGMGCTASALVAAFLTVNSNPLAASLGAMGVMGIAGEIGAKHAKGPASFQMAFLDTLYHLKEADLKKLNLERV